MTSTTARPNPTAPATEIAEHERELIDSAIETLTAGARTWSSLMVAQRVTLLRAVRAAVAEAAEEWAEVAADSKGLRRGHPLRGEEWLSGPYAALGALDAYIDTLRKISDGRSALDGVRTARARVAAPEWQRFPSPAPTRFSCRGSRARSGWSRGSRRRPHVATPGSGS